MQLSILTISVWYSLNNNSPHLSVLLFLKVLLSADEPPGSVRSEFADLSIYHPIPSKRHHYNPHTLNNTTDFRSIGHKHSDTVLKL